MKLILPVLGDIDLTEDEATVYQVLSKTIPKSGYFDIYLCNIKGCNHLDTRGTCSL